MNSALQQEAKDIFTDMLQILSKFKVEQLDIIPFEGSWTAGQVAEHIIKANAGIPKLCRGETEEPMPDRVEKLSDMNALFNNYSIKMDSPKSIVPISTNNLLEPILISIKTIQSEFINVIKSEDLNLICLDFAFPTFGYLSRSEWINFGLIHTKRHTNQLVNILDKLNTK